MSSFILKLIAIITMTIDHLGYVIYGKLSWMNYIGRLAFPIFAWQISLGFQKTKDVKLYAFRLLISALITQPIYMLYMSSIGVSMANMNLNVIFTLLAGLICLIFINKHKLIGIIVSIIIMGIANLLKFEYGIYGILVILIFYIFRNNKVLLILMQALNLFMYYIFEHGKVQMYSIISVLMIVLLYNHKKGKSLKYLFYIFYPLQFLILYLIKINLI